MASKKKEVVLNESLEGIEAAQAERAGASDAEEVAEEVDDEDSEDEEEDDGAANAAKTAKVVNYKSKPRRKATQRPVGSDQKRQAFSKRKRGMVQKSFQLYKLTDAKVFIFIANDKGTTWAYSTPGFGIALNSNHMKTMRQYAGVENAAKKTTEVGS